MYNLNIKFMKKPNQKNDTDSDGVVMEPIHDVGNSGDDLDDSVVAEESQKDTIAKLREKIKQLEATKQEYLTGWQRDKADFINARKRDEADRREFMKFANEQLIFDIIPVLEHWDLAMSHKESWEKADKNWRVGVESIFNQLKNTLTDNGLTEINPVGEQFDHSKHEAMAYEPVTDKKQDHVVLAVVQKGYFYNGKVLKPAKVNVGEFK